MNTLENFLTDIPRYENADIVERTKFNMGDYKTFYVTPENTSPAGRSIFMVKGEDVFPAHKKNFFQKLMADMYASGELQSWDAVRFSEVYLIIGRLMDAKIIANKAKANR